jgi:hypothetical protein
LGRFLGYLGAHDAPLRVFGVIWAQAMRPYGFLGGWAHAMRPYGFWGNLGIWAHAMRPYEFWGYLGAPEGKKPPHQVNLDTFREKIFSVQGVLKIEEGTQNQVAGIFPLGMVAQFIEFSWNL